MFAGKREAVEELPKRGPGRAKKAKVEEIERDEVLESVSLLQQQPGAYGEVVVTKMSRRVSRSGEACNHWSCCSLYCCLNK